MAVLTSRCWSCGRTDVRKRPRHGKLFYRHRCPHGRECHAGHYGEGFNGPPMGGKYYCADCFAAARKGAN